jgi:hypothetical protein
MPTATYTVEIDFENSTGSAAVYQSAGGTVSTYAASSSAYTPAQSYANSAAQTFSGTYDLVTVDTTRMEIQRGRDDIGGPYRPGQAKITLQRVTNDPNAPGAGGRELYNPASTTSPISPQYTGTSPAKVEPGIRPLRPVRVTMDVGGTDRVLFYGFITSWRYKRETGEAEIVARDVLWRLSKNLPVTTQSAGETTATAIGKLLDNAGWTAAADRDLNPTIQGVPAGVGRTLPASTFTYDGTEKTGFAILDDLLAASRGLVYCAGATVVHEDYPARSLRKTADLTLADVALEYDPGFEVE